MTKSLLQKLFLSVSAVMILFSLSTALVSAQNNPLIPCNGANGVDNSSGAVNNRECTFNDLVTGTQAVAAKIVQIGLIISPIIFAYAGFLLLTSQDKPGQRDTAKKIGWNVVKGIAIMMLAWVFVNLILTALLKGDVYSALPWNK